MTGIETAGPGARHRRRHAGKTAPLAAGLLALLSAAAPAFAAPAVPVRFGGDPVAAACATRAVLGESEAREGLVDIRSGPTGTFRVLERLPAGTEVYRCDENGTFVGIVYGEGDCGVEEPLDRRAAYRGPCASGWVHNRALEPSPGGPA
ncbi:integron [Aureimonas mangrovi]|uniref:integron n=1 Tax=Aureimonas mangrovi TaxID=2758041 RepID=UPI00163D848D|nr:integron [Aureimonas mangrovi]